MEGHELPNPKPRKGGIPLWVALVALLVLVLTAGGIFVGMLWYTQNAKHRQEVLLQEAEARKVEAKLAEEKAAQDAKLAAARNRQEDALRVTRSATNALERFAAALASVHADADALKTNDAGRLVALHLSLIHI